MKNVNDNTETGNQIIDRLYLGEAWMSIPKVDLKYLDGLKTKITQDDAMINAVVEMEASKENFECLVKQLVACQKHGAKVIDMPPFKIAA